MKPYNEALRECNKVGTAHASGDSLAAMYAGLVALSHGGEPQKYYPHLAAFKTDPEITEQSRALLRDRQAAYDVLIA